MPTPYLLMAALHVRRLHYGDSATRSEPPENDRRQCYEFRHEASLPYQPWMIALRALENSAVMRNTWQELSDRLCVCARKASREALRATISDLEYMLVFALPFDRLLCLPFSEFPVPWWRDFVVWGLVGFVGCSFVGRLCRAGSALVCRDACWFSASGCPGVTRYSYPWGSSAHVPGADGSRLGQADARPQTVCEAI